jgi:hypothetical protein
MGIKFLDFLCQGVISFRVVLHSVFCIFTQVAVFHLIVVVSIRLTPVFLVNHLEIERVLVIANSGLSALFCGWQVHCC